MFGFTECLGEVSIFARAQDHGPGKENDGCEDDKADDEHGPVEGGLVGFFHGREGGGLGGRGQMGDLVGSV